MPSPATLAVTAGFPLPLVYATQAGHIAAAVTSKAGAAVTVSGLAAAKTSVS